MAGNKDSGNRTDRVKNWTVIVYPESAPENWREILDSLHMEWVESPLHEFDLDENGALKKPHYHLLLSFDTARTKDKVMEIIKPLNCPIPMKVMSARALVRYMAHLDNPEKHQYPVSKIKAHGGIDLEELLRKTASERYQLISDMLQFIKDNEITEFQDLMDVARTEFFDTWFPLLCDNSAYVIGQYIKSVRHRKEREHGIYG